MRLMLPADFMVKVIAVLKQSVEGGSINSTERIPRVHRDTILSLLEVIGSKCVRLMEEKITGVPVGNVQCHEILGFVEQKGKSKKLTFKESDESIGDAWCFVAIEQTTKLILTLAAGLR